MNFDIPDNKQLILFDGVCNLCNTNVLRVIKNDYQNRFVFASLQSNLGSKIVKAANIDIKKVNSVLLYIPKQQKVLYKSKAVFTIAQQLKLPYQLLTIFKILPNFISDFVYDFVAKNRYRWYGKKNACMIPTLELKAKFLEY